jgi:hypothetical protein
MGRAQVDRAAPLGLETIPTSARQVPLTDSVVPGWRDTAIMTIQLNDLIRAADPTDPMSDGGSMSVWQRFARLPALAAKKREEKTDEDGQKDDYWQQEHVERRLDPIITADND